MAKFFTGDWHLSEKKAPNTWSFHRDFDSPEEMNDLIIQKINKYVGADDELYVLGDVAVGPECEPWLKQIICKNLFLIAGEKDDSTKNPWVRDILPNYFQSPWSNTMEVNISTLPDVTLILGHKPSTANLFLNQAIDANRFTKEASQFFGLFAHVHRAKTVSKNRDMLNVGCDLWDYVPLSEERIAHLHGAVTKFWDNEVYD